ncbi:MAG: 16S rRNA (guanine(527)-N(7))-methyltransferase RsmG [Lachnospiraceae bacterium]|nr:16S rRNA (guanine(527)-N(7))-methyltransferase RsmG [Lachnospiraceae bacterium]
MNEAAYILDKVGRVLPGMTEAQAEQFLRYEQMLVEKNKVMNLTAITEFPDVVRKHFVDSLMITEAIPAEKLQEPCKAIDLGTGAGFPGIPLKIAYPQIGMVLVDSLAKRVRFLQEVIDALGLTGVTAIHARAEDLGRDPKHREQYDLCVSRAVANLATLSEYCMPLVKPGGIFLPYKSGEGRTEAEEAKPAIFLCAGKTEQIAEYELPGEPEEEVMKRTLILIRKTGPISKKYPRNAGKPAKDPLH